MLNPSSAWWKYMGISKFTQLMQEAEVIFEGSIKYLSVTPTGNIALLDSNLVRLATVDISSEELEIYQEYF